MIKNWQSNKLFLVLLAASSILIIGIVIILSREQSRIQSASPAPSDTTPKRFSSKTMKIELQVPEGFRVEDKNVELLLTGRAGEIRVSKIGTNYENLADYLAEYDRRQKPVVSNIKKLTIDGKEALSRVITFPKQQVTQKTYYIYISDVVYTISTQSGELYDDLDQIALSFRYTP